MNESNSLTLSYLVITLEKDKVGKSLSLELAVVLKQKI